jgi:hypothetical protein
VIPEDSIEAEESMRKCGSWRRNCRTCQTAVARAATRHSKPAASTMRPNRVRRRARQRAPFLGGTLRRARRNRSASSAGLTRAAGFFFRCGEAGAEGRRNTSSSSTNWSSTVRSSASAVPSRRPVHAFSFATPEPGRGDRHPDDSLSARRSPPFHCENCDQENPRCQPLLLGLWLCSAMTEPHV